MRFKRRVVLPLPRKPVRIVMGMGAILFLRWWFCGGVGLYI